MSDSYVVVEKKPSNGLAIAALVCGLVALFCINPAYLVSIAAVILGIIALCTKCRSKAMAIVGLCLGAGSILWGLLMDTLATIFTGGLGFVSYFL